MIELNKLFESIILNKDNNLKIQKAESSKNNFNTLNTIRKRKPTNTYY